jgi:Zn-dependent protease
MGTLVFVVSAMAGAGFGWGKPTPVNPRNFKDPRWDDVFISAAGPASNLLTAIVLAIIYNLAYYMGAFQAGAWWLPAIWMLEAGVQVNIILALFNLIPLPPLDGSKILAGFLSPRAEAAYWHYTRHGFLILLALLFLPGLVPGFPDVIHYLLVTPASVLIGILLG